MVLIDKEERKVLLREHGQLYLFEPWATDGSSFNRIWTLLTIGWTSHQYTIQQSSITLFSAVKLSHSLRSCISIKVHNLCTAFYQIPPWYWMPISFSLPRQRTWVFAEKKTLWLFTAGFLHFTMSSFPSAMMKVKLLWIRMPGFLRQHLGFLPTALAS